MRSRFFAVGLVSLGCLAVACGDGDPNDAPILDSVSAPAVVAETNGAYRIPVLVLFHDNDREAITAVRWRVGSYDGTIAVDTPEPTRESAEVTLVVPAAACGDKSHQRIELTVVDARGAESHPLPSIVTLK